MNVTDKSTSMMELSFIHTSHPCRPFVTGFWQLITAKVQMELAFSEHAPAELVTLRCDHSRHSHQSSDTRGSCLPDVAPGREGG